MTQTPSIGRIVHYNHTDCDYTSPAIIVGTYSDHPTQVDLFVMTPTGSFNTTAYQGDDEFEWHWPPYVPAKPRPVPTKADVASIIDRCIDSPIIDTYRAADAIMDLFKEFLK